MFETNLEISRDFKYVKYDGRQYKVKEVVKFPKTYTTTYGVNASHQCTGNRSFSIEFDRIFELEKGKMHHVCFCNRCKKLFIKEVV